MTDLAVQQDRDAINSMLDFMVSDTRPAVPGASDLLSKRRPPNLPQLPPLMSTLGVPAPANPQGMPFYWICYVLGALWHVESC